MPATVATTAAAPPVAPVVVSGVDWQVLIPLIFAGLALLITTTGNLILSRKNGKKVDQVHVLVNSRMTNTLAKVAAAEEEIRGLRALVVTLSSRINEGHPAVDGDKVREALATLNLPHTHSRKGEGRTQP